MKKLVIQRLTLPSIFKITLIGLMISVVPLYTALGILATFGAPTLNIGGQFVIGATAILAGPLYGILVALFMTIIVTPLCWLGLWLLSKYSNVTFTIEVDGFEDPENEPEITPANTVDVKPAKKSEPRASVPLKKEEQPATSEGSNEDSDEESPKSSGGSKN